MGGVCVPEAVWMQRSVARNHPRVELDDFASSAVRQAPAAMIHQQRTFSRLGSALRQVLLERRRRFFSVWHLPFLAALAAHANPALAEGEVFDVQSHQFADPQAAPL